MKISFMFTFLLATVMVNAQIGLRVFKDYPLKGSPVIYDNTVSGELLFLFKIDGEERFVARGGFTLMDHKFKFDVFPSYQLLVDGSWMLAVESDITMEHFQEYYASIGGNINAFNGEKLKIYAGVDVLIGGYQIRFNSNFAFLNQGDTVDAGLLFGYRLRVGTSYYLIESLQLFAETNWAKRSYGGRDGIPSIDLGAGVAYYYSR